MHGIAFAYLEIIHTPIKTRREMRKGQQGFTLIEIAIVLVIIGLLLGGVLKGQELIQNARVRNIIAQQDGVKSAFFAFQDRYRGVAGDYLSNLATQNIPGMMGQGCAPNNCGGNGDGSINTAVRQEPLLAWMQLSLAGFITGSYVTDGTTAGGTTANSPTNPYGGFMQLINDSVYDGSANVSRNNVKTGAGIPSTVLGEVDRKIDDGDPSRGEFRFTNFGGAAPACIIAAVAPAPASWDVNTGQANCGAVSLF